MATFGHELLPAGAWRARSPCATGLAGGRRSASRRGPGTPAAQWSSRGGIVLDGGLLAVVGALGVLGCMLRAVRSAPSIAENSRPHRGRPGQNTG